jgi:tRNA-binding EMAP/Myf-like protein
LSLEDGAYQIFKLPNPESFYVIGVDVGEGIGRSNSVAQILDVSNLQDIQQVALFASNNINPFHFGTRLMGILQDQKDYINRK